MASTIIHVAIANELNKVLDYFNIMSYDLDDSSKTSHMCALHNSDNAILRKSKDIASGCP